MTEPRYPGVEVQLSGEDGNALAIIGAARRALRRAGVPIAVVNEFSNEAMSGDYDNVLRTVMAWVSTS